MFQSRERPPITFQRSLRNKRSMGNKIGVPVAQRSDVSNFFKNIPNFMKDVSNFIKGVPNFVKNVSRGPKLVLKWGTTSNHFLRLSKWINEQWEGRQVSR